MTATMSESKKIELIEKYSALLRFSKDLTQLNEIFDEVYGLGKSSALAEVESKEPKKDFSDLSGEDKRKARLLAEKCFEAPSPVLAVQHTIQRYMQLISSKRGESGK